MTSWNFSNIHNQTGVVTKSSTGTWSYVPTDGDNPDNEYLTVSGTTVSWNNIGEYQDYARYTWPASHSTGDIVSTDGTAITGFTHNWGHTSLGGSQLTITEVPSTNNNGDTGTEGNNNVIDPLCDCPLDDPPPIPTYVSRSGRGGSLNFW